ncbi:type IV toxin-antitoxin system AbiEi family antitoxin domain-containing protein [Nocardioides caldifontis]|uniref:type IV toxin-antitoxin system AbiEi family antitoxin domain-containing protein n=1 Tax=Nocardioides caldifontis TaxID=2588938 RepID=UPI0011DFCC65|nr:type IV toxin-antitoxin system AbiEi family antitoxin domain-containing protein [Nocardioides caldifontis]
MQLPFLFDQPAVLDERFPLPLDAPFTTAQARVAGVSSNQLTRLVNQGYLRRLVKGVYAAAQLPDSRVLRGRAIALVAPPGSVVCDWTACWYWTGVDRPGAHRGTPPLDVFRFRGHQRLRNGLVTSGERWFLPSDVVPLDGDVRVATPIRTAWDLGRFAPRISAIGGMDALARTGSFSVEELNGDVERFRRQRGVVQLRYLAPLVDPRAESTGESGLRLRWKECPRLPAPELQIPVYAEDGTLLYRIDLGVEELRLGVEYDGEEWHSSESDRAHDFGRRTSLEDRFDWGIDVFRRSHVYGQREIVTARLPQAVRESRLALRGDRAARLPRAERWRS